MKKVILIGASGTIGSATNESLKTAGYDVFTASFSGNKTDFSVDIQDPSSIKNLFERVGSFDALVSTTGKVAFKNIQEIEQQDWDLSLSNKLFENNGSACPVKELFPTSVIETKLKDFVRKLS